ncbi:hypothetical protein BaRGS_00007270 [Batillaria attramentaria]|uniref:Uncharacterized protein n=1 Tax=Batillaria attramentaria TaxID=370345 RepID=A0ABD0LQN1_9CAEN
MTTFFFFYVSDPEESPFWSVDLGQIEHVRSVRLYGSDANPLHDLDVHLGNSENVTDNALCTRYRGHTSSLDVRIVCDTELSGRYIGIVQRAKPHHPESLILCETLVFLM